MTRAIVMTGPGEPLAARDVELDAPRAGEIRVGVAASGVCHSDLHVYEDASISVRLPIVLGHEASGVVLETGAHVDDLAVGDHIVMSVLPQCGVCRFCRDGSPTMCVESLVTSQGTLPDGSTRVRLDGQHIGQHAGLGAWSEETIIDRRSAVKIDPDMPLTSAALLGCAVVTGYGAVANVGDVRAGDAVVIIGCGGVGLGAVQTARIIGANPIVAIDISVGKLSRARAMGATHAIDSSTVDVLAHVQEITDGLGVRVGLDFVGTPSTTETVLSLTRRGGTVVLTGLAGGRLDININDLVRSGKSIKANLMGMGWFREQVPKLVRLYQDGELLLDDLVSQKLALDEVDVALHSMSHGDVARSVLVMQ